jgi:choline-sulfatase
MIARTMPKLSRLLALVLGIAALVVLVLALRPSLQRSRGPYTGQIPRTERSLLLITVDTTRADRLEPYGARDVETPVMTQLAAESVLFEQALAVAPITLVAHASLLTGLHPPRHGVRNNGTHFAAEKLELLSETLRARGFRTGAVVSASVLEARYGLSQGFEHYDDDLSDGRDRHPRVVADRPAEFTVDRARRWLDGLGPRERFLLWVHFYDPHANYAPPPPYRERYRERPYDGEIAYMDREIGRLLEHPRLAGAEDVVTALIGDHGESLGEHGESSHAILAYQSTLHVPFLLRIPGLPGGIRVAEPVSQVDLAPTLLDLLSLPVPPNLDGGSLLPLLEGRTPSRTAPGALYAETYLPFYTYGWAKLRAVRDGRWKLIDAPTPELYDLERDPRELTNLHQRRSEIARDLRQRLDTFLEQTGDPEREQTMTLDSETAEQLRQLGYLAVGSEPPRRDGDRPNPMEVVGVHASLQRAHQLQRNRLYDQARSQLDSVLERDPGNLAAHLDLASVLADDDQVDRAFEVLQRALELDPSYPRIQLALAQVETLRGNREAALGLVDLALELDPRNPEARMQRSNLLRSLGRAVEAAAVLENALEELPTHPRLNIAYARTVELARGDLPAAELRIRRALETDPFLAAGWTALGEMLERDERAAEAVATYRSGLERQPDSHELHGNLGTLLARQGDRAGAESHLREATRLSPTFQPGLHVTLGALLAETGRVSDAEREYERVLAREPEHPGALNNRAIALYRTGRREEAREILETLVGAHPNHADAHNNLAAVYLDLERFDLAEQAARHAIEVTPALPEAWNNLGISLEELGRLRDAEGAYLRALEIDPDYWQGRHNLATNLTRQQRHREAVTELEKVLAAAPEVATVHLDLGELYAGALAEPERARRHFNTFLRLAPRHERVSEIRRRLADLL